MTAVPARPKPPHLSLETPCAPTLVKAHAANKPPRPGSRSRNRPSTGAPALEAAREDLRGQVQEELLAQITHGGRLCLEIEKQFGENPAPELETLIKLYRVLILKFSLEAQVAPELFRLVTDLMKPVMEWARLQEKRRERELAEQKYRDQAEAQKASQAKEQQARSGEAALTSETIEKIQRELKLM
jgi:hypothetical protein